jgi:hypothetical protein
MTARIAASIHPKNLPEHRVTVDNVLLHAQALGPALIF